MLAAGFGHAAVVEALLKAGAFVDMPDDSGNTALALSSLRGHDRVSIMLDSRSFICRCVQFRLDNDTFYGVATEFDPVSFKYTILVDNGARVQIDAVNLSLRDYETLGEFETLFADL